ncbi:MAG: hypothetical protein DWQ35_00365 [Planctomycetota bacterium]|nr:MAG: hypothetical protein DWQ35_00365 [Planctomycetota bacterium]
MRQVKGPLRLVDAWNLAPGCPDKALLECGHVVRHEPYLGERYLGAPVNGRLRRILLAEAKTQLPERKRCPKCRLAEPLFEGRDRRPSP